LRLCAARFSLRDPNRENASIFTFPRAINYPRNVPNIEIKEGCICDYSRQINNNKERKESRRTREGIDVNKLPSWSGSLLVGTFSWSKATQSYMKMLFQARNINSIRTKSRNWRGKAIDFTPSTSPSIPLPSLKGDDCVSVSVDLRKRPAKKAEHQPVCANMSRVCRFLLKIIYAAKWIRTTFCRKQMDIETTKVLPGHDPNMKKGNANRNNYNSRLSAERNLEFHLNLQRKASPSTIETRRLAEYASENKLASKLPLLELLELLRRLCIRIWRKLRARNKVLSDKGREYLKLRQRMYSIELTKWVSKYMHVWFI